MARTTVSDIPGGVRVKQAAVVLLGLVLAAAMVMLGWWQLEVYQESGDQASAARLAEPAVGLADVAPAGAEAGEYYGRTVRITGNYDVARQVLVPDVARPGTFRVVTAFIDSRGDAVAVVRGVHSGDPGDVPAPPSGTVTQEGILMPSEATDETPVEPGQLSSVRLSVLAQQWPWPLVAGFVTLTADDTTPGLAFEAPELPREGGALRNGAYAIQWWVFAAFAVGLGLKMARDFGREAQLESIRLEGATEGSEEKVSHP